MRCTSTGGIRGNGGRATARRRRGRAKGRNNLLRRQPNSDSVISSKQMTMISLGEEPACPGPLGFEDATQTTTRTTDRPVRVIPRHFDDVSREAWDSVATANPWATPFSGWAFQRAWWDAYGGSAHDQTLVVTATAGTAGGAEAGDLVAIVPLMHRHMVEPTDADMATHIRHADPTPLTQVPPTAKAIFFGASYHADYATILTAPADLPAVADALAGFLAADAHTIDPEHPASW